MNAHRRNWTIAILRPSVPTPGAVLTAFAVRASKIPTRTSRTRLAGVVYPAHPAIAITGARAPIRPIKCNALVPEIITVHSVKSTEKFWALLLELRSLHSSSLFWLSCVSSCGGKFILVFFLILSPAFFRHPLRQSIRDGASLDWPRLMCLFKDLPICRGSRNPLTLEIYELCILYFFFYNASMVNHCVALLQAPYTMFFLHILFSSCYYCFLHSRELSKRLTANLAHNLHCTHYLFFLHSRRWSREQKAVGSPVYGYMQGGIPGTLPGETPLSYHFFFYPLLFIFSLSNQINCFRHSGEGWLGRNFGFGQTRPTNQSATLHVGPHQRPYGYCQSLCGETTFSVSFQTFSVFLPHVTHSVKNRYTWSFETLRKILKLFRIFLAGIEIDRLCEVADLKWALVFQDWTNGAYEAKFRNVRLSNDEHARHFETCTAAKTPGTPKTSTEAQSAGTG